MAAQLNAGIKQSCGCHQIKDYTGQHFGELTVIKRISQKNIRTKYECVCSCGNKISCDGSKLKDRNSCGCKRKSRPRLPIAEVVRNYLFSGYKANAKSKNLPFRLSKKQFHKMIFGKCYYCGDPPKTLFRKWREEENCKYNGIDRKDNNIGYTSANCVSCCKECNYKKNAQHIDDFFHWVLKVADHIRDKT